MSLFEDETPTRVVDRKPDGEVFDGEPTALAPITPAVHMDDLTPLIRAASAAGPRDHEAILKQAELLGSKMGRLAFYSFPAGGTTVEGATIKLAYALVMLWGRMRVNGVIVGVNGSQIIIRGEVLDLTTVVASGRDAVFTIAPPPGKFAKKPDQIERWNAMQIQSAMSKAVRGAILSCIPGYIVEAALDAAMRVAKAAVLHELQAPDLPTGIEKLINGFEKRFGVTLEELEATAGKPKALWAMHELDMLYQTVLDIKNGVTTAAAFRAAAAKLISRPVAAETAAPWAEEAKPAPAPETPPPAEPAKPKPDPKPAAKSTTAASDDGVDL